VMFSFKRTILAIAATGFSLAVVVGCKTSEKKTVAPAVAPPVQANKVPPQAAPPAAPPVLPSDSGNNMAPNILAWDSLEKEYHAQPGERIAPFVFNLTNVSPQYVVVYDTSTSCDCTVAKLPSKPWAIPGGGVGQIEATI